MIWKWSIVTTNAQLLRYLYTLNCTDSRVLKVIYIAGINVQVHTFVFQCYSFSTGNVTDFMISLRYKHL